MALNSSSSEKERWVCFINYLLFDKFLCEVSLCFLVPWMTRWCKWRIPFNCETTSKMMSLWMISSWDNFLGQESFKRNTFFKEHVKNRVLWEDLSRETTRASREQIVLYTTWGSQRHDLLSARLRKSLSWLEKWSFSQLVKILVDMQYTMHWKVFVDSSGNTNPEGMLLQYKSLLPQLTTFVNSGRHYVRCVCVPHLLKEYFAIFERMIRFLWWLRPSTVLLLCFKSIFFLSSTNIFLVIARKTLSCLRIDWQKL